MKQFNSKDFSGKQVFPQPLNNDARKLIYEKNVLIGLDYERFLTFIPCCAIAMLLLEIQYTTLLSVLGT